MKRVTSFAIALVISLGATAFAQQPVANDAARQDSVVKQAMRTYQQGLNDIKEPANSRAVPLSIRFLTSAETPSDSISAPGRSSPSGNG